MYIRRIIVVAGVLSLVAGFALASSERIERFHEFSNRVPAPYLLSPTKEMVDISGKTELEFKWSPHEQGVGFRDYYDFRLYKGYNTYQSTLMLKKQLAPGEYSIKLSTDMFENGQVYTWTLRQAYNAEKSQPSYYSFKVIKK